MYFYILTDMIRATNEVIKFCNYNLYQYFTLQNTFLCLKLGIESQYDY